MRLLDGMFVVDASNVKLGLGLRVVYAAILIGDIVVLLDGLA